MSKVEQSSHVVIRQQRTIVDIYCRVSTDDQEENTSLDTQEAEGRAYCKENGFIVGEVHKEVFTGYKYRERKKLGIMRQRYRDGKIQVVVIRTLDRLSRSQSHVAILIEEMEHYNVTLHSVKEVLDETPMGKFARMVLAFVAEMEREKILDRTATGRIEKAKEGKASAIVGGPKPLYGWKWNNPIDKDYLVLDEEAVKVLQKAAQEYIDGMPMNQIINRFIRDGIPTPNGSGRWYPATLMRILTDKRMTGTGVNAFITRKAKGAKQPLPSVAVPDGIYPRILGDDLYERIIMRAKANATGAPRNSRCPEMFLLRAGFAYCSVCNYRLMSRMQRFPNERVTPYYFCRNQYCANRYRVFEATNLDAQIWKELEQMADHVALMEQAVELAMANHTVADDLSATENAIETWKGKIANFESDLEDVSLRGDTRAAIRNHLNAAYEMLEQLETDRADLLGYVIDIEKQRVEFEKILDWCRKVKSDREELTYTQKRDFLRILGVRVLVTREPGRRGALSWDIRVSLPEVQEIVYHTHNVLIENCTLRNKMA